MATERSIYANQATVVGEVLSMSIKTGDKKNPRAGEPTKWEMLEAEISACGSKIKVSVWPTKKDANKHQTIYKSIAAGKRVLVRGTVQEQVSEEGRIFRQVQAFVFELASDIETDKMVYYVVGHLGHPTKTSADGKETVVTPVTVVEKYESNGEPQQKEKTVHIHPAPAMLETLYKKVSPGRIIQARGHIVNRISFDEFGVPEGYQSALDVAKLEAWDEQNSMWLVVSDSLPSSLPAGEVAAEKAKPLSTGNLLNDDDDVPF